MAKFRFNKNSLVSGEVSPTAFGRVDLPQYQHACKTLRNTIPMLSGGAYRRPGSVYVDSISSATNFAPRLFPFVFSQNESYLLYLNRVIGGAEYLSGYRFSDNSNAFTALTCTGVHPYAQSTAVTHSYDEVSDVQYAQSADIMYLVHPNRFPQRISRTAANTFHIDQFDLGFLNTTMRDGHPYRAQTQNPVGVTLTPSAVNGNITLTASAPFFNAGHVGAYFKIDDGAGTYGAARVTGFTSTTVVNATTVVNFGTTGARGTWWEEAWSAYRGYPKTIGFYQNRLVYGGNSAEPDTLWFSQTYDYNQLSISDAVDPRTSPTGTDPFTITLSSKQLNEINWMSNEVTMVIGTQGAEWAIDRETDTIGFGCDNAKAVTKSNYGSAYFQVERANDELFFCSNTRNEIKGLVFSYLEQSYTTDPLQVFYDEYPKAETNSVNLGSRRYRCIGWDSSRSTLWCVDTSGHFFGMTRDRQLQITAWHSHQMGGWDETEVSTAPLYLGQPATDPVYTAHSGYVSSMCVLPNGFTGGSDICLVVKRKINGIFQYMIERIIGKQIVVDSSYGVVMTAPFPGTALQDASRLTDAGFGSSSGYNSTISSMSYLEGKTLDITAYGSTYGIFHANGSAVSGGSSTMSPKPTKIDTTEYYFISAGLQFSSIVEPTRPEAGSQIGSAQGAIKRIHLATVRFYRTIHARLGQDSSTLETILFRDPTAALGKSAELFTGDKQIYPNSDYTLDGFLYIVQDKGLPFCVISISAEGQEYD